MNNLPPVNNNAAALPVPVNPANNNGHAVAPAAGGLVIPAINADFMLGVSGGPLTLGGGAPAAPPHLPASSSAGMCSAAAAASASAAAQYGSPQVNASQTEIKVERVTHHWTVKNFSHCYQEYLENFVNLVKNEETLTWSVKIYPKGNGENNKDFVFLCLNRVLTSSASSNGKLGKVGFKSRFVLRNSENKEIEMRVHPNPSHSDYVSYIKRDVLFPQISPKDIIVVTVEIDVAVETVLTANNEEMFFVPDPTIQLLNDYERLFKSHQFCDFIIEVGNRKINTHRNVLSMRSTVFNAMLSHDTDEARRGVLEIKDLDFDVVNEMLYFIYCGKTPKVCELAADLLVAADKYSIQDLKLRSEKTLIGALSIENACDLLTMADAHAADHLKERAVQFVVTHAPHVTRTNGWQLMLKQRPELVTEVVQAFNKPQSADVYCFNPRSDFS